MKREKKTPNYITQIEIPHYLADVIKKHCIETNDNVNNFIQKAIVNFVDANCNIEYSCPRCDYTVTEYSHIETNFGWRTDSKTGKKFPQSHCRLCRNQEVKNNKAKKNQEEAK